MNIPLNAFIERECTCGHRLFDQAAKIKIYEGILSPAPVIQTDIVLVCRSCQAVYLLPTDLKTPYHATLQTKKIDS